MAYVATLFVNQYEVRVRIWALLCQYLRDVQQGQLCGDDTYEVSFCIAKRITIGGYHAISVEVQLVVLITVQHPTRLVLYSWNGIPASAEIVVVRS